MKKKTWLALLMVLVFTMIPFVSNAATNDWEKHTTADSTVVYAKDMIVGIYYHVPKEKGKWYHNSKGWWYQWSDGTYPTDAVLNLNGKYYQIKKDGYLVQNGYYDGHWFDKNGVMQFGSGCNGAKWYHNNKGWWYGVTVYNETIWYMKKGWLEIDGKWYFFDNKGYILRNCALEVGDKTYFFNGSGALAKTAGAKDFGILPEYVKYWAISDNGKTIRSITKLEY